MAPSQSVAGTIADIKLLPDSGAAPQAYRVGFRFGRVGTHTSRTMMLAELGALLESTHPDALRPDYVEAIVEANCLEKPTVATRRLTAQRLSELYSLDPALPLFRVLRRLWHLDSKSRPLLALLCALARDPMLAVTAGTVIALPPGAELQRGQLRDVLRAFVEDRLGDATLDKVVRNVASTWAQAGHLKGRTFKIRQRVTPTAVAIAYALYLATAAGFGPEQALASGWIKVLDCGASSARDLALDAKRIGLIDLRTAGDVFDLDLSRLDSAVVERT